MRSILALFLVSQGHAGIIRTLCDKLIIDAPFEFSMLENEDLRRRLRYLDIRIRWSKATAIERNEYQAIQAELGRRGCGD